jgi:hypothetical protein
LTDENDTPATTGAIAKRTEALLRDARSVQRRLDVLAAMAQAMEDPSLLRIAEARAVVKQLVMELSYRQQGEQRRAKAPRRRIR